MLCGKFIEFANFPAKSNYLDETMHYLFSDKLAETLEIHVSQEIFVTC
jgi:hypothetical protein